MVTEKGQDVPTSTQSKQVLPRSKPPSSGALVSIVIPVYNERENIDPLITKIHAALADFDYEIIFVDDHSPDGTINHIWQRSQENQRIRGLLRLNRTGLASAATEGILSSSAPIVIVMDGDGQHDARALPDMITPLYNDEAALCIASRYLAPTHHQGLNSSWRMALSQLGNRLAQRICRTTIRDPLSGFFSIRRTLFVHYAPYLFLKGYKLLLDLLTLLPTDVTVKEIPAPFLKRHAGESKLRLSVIAHFLRFLLVAYFRRRHLHQKETG